MDQMDMSKQSGGLRILEIHESTYLRETGGQPHGQSARSRRKANPENPVEIRPPSSSHPQPKRVISLRQPLCPPLHPVIALSDLSSREGTGVDT